MEQERLRVDPKCMWLIEAFRECPLGASRYGRRRPYGAYSHVTDAASYPLVFLEWTRTETLQIAPEDIICVTIKRPGSDFFGGYTW